MKVIDIIIILIAVSLSGSYGLTAPSEVNGRLGESITVDCQYNIASNRDSEKYWCKGKMSYSCTVLASTTEVQQERSSRLFIMDNQTIGIFSVKMQQLSPEDAGWYWCGITRLGKDEMTCVKLNVLTAGLTGLRQVHGTLGDTVTIQCRYQVPYYKNHEKYLCKGSDRKSCIVITGTRKQNPNSGGRIMAMDNQTIGVFAVTITQLSMEDKGIYWCGITIFGYDRMDPLQLIIFEPPTTTVLPAESQRAISFKNESTSNFSIIVVPVLGIVVVLFLVVAIFATRYKKKTAVGEKELKPTEEDSNPIYTDLSFRDYGEDITYDMETSKSLNWTEDFPTYICDKQKHDQKEPICFPPIKPDKVSTSSSQSLIKAAQQVLRLVLLHTRALPTDNIGTAKIYPTETSEAMEAIVFFILISVSNSRQLTGPGDVRGEVGGSVTAECEYDQSYEENEKYWCKGYHYITCSVIVSTDNPQSGRVSMTDDKKHSILSVTMDKLMKSDEGRYWCVIENTFQNEKVSFKLEVFEGPTWSSTLGPTSSVAGTTQSHGTTDLTTSSATFSSPSEENFPLNLMASWQIILVVVVLIISVLLTAAVILYVKLKQQKKSVTVEQNTPGFGSLASSVTEDTTVMYSTVKKVPKANLEKHEASLHPCAVLPPGLVPPAGLGSICSRSGPQSPTWIPAQPVLALLPLRAPIPNSDPSSAHARPAPALGSGRDSLPGLASLVRPGLVCSHFRLWL
ncbi:uncharacterized protein LOC125486037 [Rhincodon typus]|uniref:uncharacterized protein LOC125486037 n=1 Tax=Rhincodon typus TaxID=259920 RepID=UPI00202F1704|nr:uncharacterized protein LOC125486037 [Rhincodon typus]